MPTRAGKRLLTREDWTRAALETLAAGGPPAVAVDRLAKQLGATRGSFYWHFSDRAELIRSALEEWERVNTEELIPPVEAIPDPLERLRQVFRRVYERPVDAIEIALVPLADDPLVAPVLGRVTRTRLSFLRRIFADLGLPDAEAASRAWLAYAFYVGHHQLGRNADARAAAPVALDRIVELLAAPAM